MADVNKPFSITFIVSDAYGNSDTKTMILQTENTMHYGCTVFYYKTKKES